MAIGDLLWVGFDGKTLPASLRDRIARGRVAGVILFGRNIESVEQLAALTNELGAAAPADLPLLIGIDQEGGRVQKLKALGAPWPPMARLGAEGNPELAQKVGRAMGTELATLGINCDFAPCVDVHTQPDNPIIGDRSFGTDPELVSRMGVAFAAGLGEAGILGCAKHYPGHGDTTLDSHLTLPTVELPEERLRSIELAPFRAMVAAKIPLIMTAHVVYPAVDRDKPGTLSKRWLDLLRSELGFDGVIVTDDMEMKAIQQDRLGSSAVEAVAAGCDALLVCNKEELQLECEEAVDRAASQDPTLKRRVEQSTRRLQALRRRLPPFEPIDPKAAAARFPFPDHRKLADSIGGRS